MSEADIEQALVKWAKERGWLAIKFTPRGERFWPDRIFISQYGTHVWLELKDEGEVPSKGQKYRMEQLIENDAIVHWTDNLEDAKTILMGYEV